MLNVKSLYRQQEYKNNILTAILDQKARARRKLLLAKYILTSPSWLSYLFNIYCVIPKQNKTTYCKKLALNLMLTSVLNHRKWHAWQFTCRRKVTKWDIRIPNLPESMLKSQIVSYYYFVINLFLWSSTYQTGFQEDAQ